MARLEENVGVMSDYLAAKQREFDEVMDLSRRIIRGTGKLITHLHNGMARQAGIELDEVGGLVAQMRKRDQAFRYSTMQAYQEFAEAKIFHSIKAGGKIPSDNEVGVDPEAYLMGLMDVVGELKREVLEALRDGDTAGADRYFGIMRDIYDSTRSVRFAEAVLPGFRKKQDVARIQLENAGSEILGSGAVRRKGKKK